MKKIILICSTLLFSLCFGQLKFDISEKEAYKRFVNSNVRKTVKINSKNFKEHWNYLKTTNFYEGFNVKISELAIFNNYDKKTLNFIKVVYNLDPQKVCYDCGQIIFLPKSEFNNYDKFYEFNN